MGCPREGSIVLRVAGILVQIWILAGSCLRQLAAIELGATPSTTTEQATFPRNGSTERGQARIDRGVDGTRPRDTHLGKLGESRC
jgi:hypothetical protein